MSHKAVLLQEAIDALNLFTGAIFLDATVGSGGHASEVCNRFRGVVRVIGLDADPERIEHAKKVLLEKECPAELVNENFRNLDQVLKRLGVEKVNAILFDLGLNSEQLEQSGRGFSFQHDEPLYMTFAAPEVGKLTAQEIVNHYDEDEIADTIYELGEEKYSRRIAAAIVEVRKKNPIQTTFQVVEILKGALPKNYERGRLHVATRTFQALRLAVNDELGALQEGLAKGFGALAPKGRMAVISFHSLEDRIVKVFFREKAHTDEAVLITKKPLYPTEDETRENPRARSAKLRIIEKI